MIQKFSMIQSEAYHSIFNHYTFSRQCIYFIVYMNGIVIINSNQDDMQKLKQHLFSHFQKKKRLGKT